MWISYTSIYFSVMKTPATEIGRSNGHKEFITVVSQGHGFNNFVVVLARFPL
jgi:hypothetical protein